MTDYEERVEWHMKRLRGERVPARRTEALDKLEEARLRAYADAKAVQHKSLQLVQESRGADAEYVVVPDHAPDRAAWFASKSSGDFETRDASERIEFRDGPGA